MVRQPVPVLTKGVITRIKAAALGKLPDSPVIALRSLRESASAARNEVGRRSGFLQPAGYAGPAELALLQARLAANSTLQLVAKESLLMVRWAFPLDRLCAGAALFSLARLQPQG